MMRYRSAPLARCLPDATRCCEAMRQLRPEWLICASDLPPAKARCGRTARMEMSPPPPGGPGWSHGPLSTFGLRLCKLSSAFWHCFGRIGMSELPFSETVAKTLRFFPLLQVLCDMRSSAEDVPTARGDRSSRSCPYFGSTTPNYDIIFNKRKFVCGNRASPTYE